MAVSGWRIDRNRFRVAKTSGFPRDRCSDPAQCRADSGARSSPVNSVLLASKMWHDSLIDCLVAASQFTAIGSICT